MKKLKKMSFYKNLASVQSSLLEAGESLLVQRGVDEFELCDLQNETGIQTSSIYSAYRNKYDLLLRLLQRYFYEINQILAELYVRPELTKEEVASVITDFFQNRPHMLELLSEYENDLEDNSSPDCFKDYLQGKLRFCHLYDRILIRLHKSEKEFTENNTGFGLIFMEGITGIYRGTHFSASKLNMLQEAYSDFAIPDYQESLARYIKLLII